MKNETKKIIAKENYVSTIDKKTENNLQDRYIDGSEMARQTEGKLGSW